MLYFSVYLLCFFFYKIREEEGRTGAVGSGSWYQWEGGGVRERGQEGEYVHIMYAHVCKCKSDTCRNCSRNQGREIKGEWQRGEFKYDICDTL
jgi:hypothetical protein